MARLQLRAHLWRHVRPDEHRVAKCGRVPLTGGPVVALAGDGSAHYRGLQTCGSVTACPVCAAKIRQRRAEEIDTALGRHLAGGGGAVFLTLTLPHDAGMALEAVWGAVAGAWRALVAGRHRQVLRDRFGLVGYVRATEVTHGRAGWHPHLHVLLLTARPLDLDELRLLHVFVRTRWIRHVTGAGFRAPDIFKGIRLVPVYTRDGMGAYLSKVGDDDTAGTPGLELARTDLKAGRAGGSRSPFRILADHERTGAAADWRLWSEWLIVSKGRRTLEWSRGLRARLLADEPERTDEEIAAEHEPAAPVAVIAPTVWRLLVHRRLAVAALQAVEARGLGGLLVLLSSAGLQVDAVAGDTGPPTVRSRRRGDDGGPGDLREG
ncbi:MAG: protein rep [Thermoleophilia bacterium]